MPGDIHHPFKVVGERGVSSELDYPVSCVPCAPGDRWTIIIIDLLFGEFRGAWEFRTDY